MTYTKWTPLHIVLMIHVYVSNSPIPHRGAPAVERFLDELRDLELIEISLTNRSGFVATERGITFINLFCNTPLPPMSTPEQPASDAPCQAVIQLAKEISEMALMMLLRDTEAEALKWEREADALRIGNGHLTDKLAAQQAALDAAEAALHCVHQNFTYTRDGRFITTQFAPHEVELIAAALSQIRAARGKP